LLFCFRQASTIAECYPPTPESGAAPEDDDASEEIEDDQNILEDSDALGDEAREDDTLIESMRCGKINEHLRATSESSPRGQDDDDADAIPSPAPSRETSAPQVTKRPSRLFKKRMTWSQFRKFSFYLFFYFHLASFSFTKIHFRFVQLRG
jgi:hypothetical protein